MGKQSGVAAAMALSLAAPAAAQTEQAKADEIVVIGRRSGMPLWTVTSDTTTLVLVGRIDAVAKSTQWDPDSLVEALRKADRVAFPEAHGFTASFAMIGWIAKYNAMGKLPKGQTLSRIAPPDDMRRLAALAAKGLVRPDYDTRHPLHLAQDLRHRAWSNVGHGRSASYYVGQAIHQYKLERVPIQHSDATPLVKDLFASTPQDHLPCLHAAITLAEAGPAAIQARSDAWAARQVKAVLASPVEAVERLCWPAEAMTVPGEGLTAQMKQLLAEPKVTVAVLRLRSLAEKGGVLDGLQAAGFDIKGPRWKD